MILSIFGTTSLSFSVQSQNFSSSTWDIKEEEMNMIMDFVKEYEVKYWIFYFKGNDWSLTKQFQRMIMKVKSEQVYFVGKDISSLKTSIHDYNSVTFHLYIIDNFDHLGILFRNREQNKSPHYFGRKPWRCFWVIKMRENRDWKYVLNSLNETKLNDETQLLFYSIKPDDTVAIQILHKTHNASRLIFKPFGTWSQNKKFDILQEKNTEKQHSLYGHHIRVVSAYAPPAVTYIEDHCSSISCFQGIFADVWHALVDQMNFTFTIRRAYQWGSLENGKWNGMVGMLHEGKADIAATDLTITMARSKVVDFLPTLLETTEELYMKNLGDSFSLVSYFGPFTKTSWVCITLWTIIVSIFLVIIVRFAENKSSIDISILNGYFEVTTFLLNVRCMSIPNLNSTRIAFGCALIGGIIFYYHWEAELIAYMSARKINIPFKNLEELSKAPEFKLIVAKGTVHLDTFRYSKDPIHSKLWSEKIEPHFDNLPLLGGIQKTILNDPYSVAYSDSTTKMRDSYLNCEIVDIGPPIRKTHLAFAVQKNSPFYREFREQINALKETGLVRRYIQRYNMERQSCKSYSGNPVSMHQCVITFQIICFGAIASFLLLVAEYCASFLLNKNSIKPHPIIIRPHRIQTRPKYLKKKPISISVNRINRRARYFHPNKKQLKRK